jgi:D-alanyl-D-alanine carboxypeptidase
VAGLLVVIAALAVGLAHQPGASSSSTSTAASPTHHAARHERAASSSAADRGAHHGRLGEADGAVPDHTTVFDNEVPGVARLDSDLLRALRQAATAASADGVQLYVDSGWRSPAYQEQLLREAVAKYGSEAAAARWVAAPDKSAHVSGEAVDIGPSSAASWLSEHGAAYGLCRVYGNEPWHFELRPEAIDRGCPPLYADPTQDPRVQQ